MKNIILTVLITLIVVCLGFLIIQKVSLKDTYIDVGHGRVLCGQSIKNQYGREKYCTGIQVGYGFSLSKF